MATQIKISELPLANESALSLAADDRLIFNNDNVNTQTIKFANFVDAILEQNLTFTGNCSFTQPITGPNGGDIQVGLDDLVDVQFQNVQSGQLIQYSGTQWINIDVADVTVQLSSLSVETADTPSGGGALAYDNMTGEFTFTPAVVNTFAKTDLSVTTALVASGQGALAYDNVNGVFNFTKPDCYTKAETYSQSEVDAALALKGDVGASYLKAETYSATQIDAALGGKAALTDLSVTVAAAGGQGNLIYNDAGVFTFTPADVYTASQADATFAPIGVTADTTLTGTPTAPTAATGNDTTQVATTAFVNASIAAQTATDLRTALGIKSGTDQANASAAAGELFYNTTASQYQVGA